MKKPSNTVLALAFGVVVLAVVILPRILSGSGEDTITRLPRPVRVSAAALGTLERTWQFSGHLKPEATTTLVPKVAGKVLGVLVREGDLVQEGQVLIRIEDDVARLQVEQAEAALRAMEAQYQKANQAVRPEELASAQATVRQAEQDIEIARNQLERSRVLLQSGTIPRATFEDSENQVRNAETRLENARRQVKLMEEGARSEDIAMARSQLEAQRSQLELAELQQGFSLVKASISGRVAKIHTERGQTVGPGSPLITIVSSSRIFALVTAPEVLYGEFYGQSETFTIDVRPIAYRDMAGFNAVITRISDIIDASSRSFEMEMAVDNSSALLKPGMFVRVTARKPQANEKILVPTSAVVLRNGSSAVYVIEGNEGAWTAKEVPVTVGLSSQGTVEVLTGLEVGDRVIYEGNAFLEDMEAVNILDMEGV